MISRTGPQVGILMGSASDAAVMREAAKVLDEFGVPHELKVCSAHRTPARAQQYAAGAAERGLKVIIAGAGMSAHLAGVLAAWTQLPVIGVPLEGKLGGGLDALLSTVNMPRGVPVATVSLGAVGAVNAALLAVAILALSDAELREKLRHYRQRQSEVPEDPPGS